METRAKTEVCKFNVPFRVEKDIIRLDVSVNSLKYQLDDHFIDLGCPGVYSNNGAEDPPKPMQNQSSKRRVIR